MAKDQEIVYHDIELDYEPRELMDAFHDRTERFAIIVAHRRFGKTVAVINDLIKECLELDRENVRVGYIAPYLSPVSYTHLTLPTIYSV